MKECPKNNRIDDIHLCLAFSLHVTEDTQIYFQNVSDDVLNTWVNYLEPVNRGHFKESNEVHPTSRNKIERDCIYNHEEKKKLKPNKDCIAMWGACNKDAEKVRNHLSGLCGRIMVAMEVTADSLLDSILYQISRRKDKYKAFEFRKQIAYNLAKHPEIFAPIVKNHLKVGESYESFILNLFHGLSFPVLDVVIADVIYMWNVPITIVTPKGVSNLYHKVSSKNVPIVVVWNGLLGDTAQYTATKVDNPNWKPLRGVDWAGDVSQVSNVKRAGGIAERFCRTRHVDKIMKEYNKVTDSIIDMKEELLNMHTELRCVESQVQSIKNKIEVWVGNVNKMEGNQGDV